MAKILVFYQYYCTPKGSWGTRYYEFSRRWARSGHDVTVVTSIYDKSDLVPRGFITEYEIEGVRVLAVDLKLSNRHGYARRLWSFAAYALTASWYGLTESADVTLVSSGPITVGIPGLVSRWIRRTPLVVEVRDLWPEGPIQLGALKHPVAIALARTLERVLYASADAVVALSPDQARGVQSVRPSVDVATIPNSADLDLFYPDRPVPEHVREAVDGKFVILYAGTLGLVNNGMEIVEIAGELARRGVDDVKVVIIGDGRELDEMKARVADLGISNIEFLGLLPKTDVADWFAASGATLNGVKPIEVLSACSPNKVFDSFAAGRVVLDNTTGWIRALLERTGAGISYAPGAIEDAVDRIVELKDDRAGREEMQRRAHELARAEFSRDKLAERFEEILARVARRLSESPSSKRAPLRPREASQGPPPS